MAAFSSLTACEQRCRQQVEDGVWVVAHPEKSESGVIRARFIRYMAKSALSDAARGEWETTDQDDVD